MEAKSVKVNCNWCGKEIECPDDMLKVKKHMCYECFKKIEGEIKTKKLERVHIDITNEELKEDVIKNLNSEI